MWNIGVEFRLLAQGPGSPLLLLGSYTVYVASL